MEKRKMNLQLFADGGEGNQNTEPQQEGQNQQQEKTYTQAQVNAMMANEKKQGKNSILRALGIATVEEGKQKMQKASENQTDEEKAAELLNTANKKADEAERRALTAERKLAVISKGVKPEFADDVVFIAGSKVSDAKDFDAILESMKETHSFYFNGVQDKGGTGKSGAGYRKQQGEQEPGSYGKMLAENVKKSSAAEFKFFDN